MDRETSWATVHGVTKSSKRLSDRTYNIHTHTHTHTCLHTQTQTYTKSFHQVTGVIEPTAHQIIPIRLILEAAGMMVPLPRLSCQMVPLVEP